ncbi:MAG: UDP-N-acetylglucosamine 2-epimerase (non-hydrolyzing) [Bacteroidales bacterium]
MKKILTVIGARPQFIKAAAVSAAIAKRNGMIKEVLVHTGQHFDDNMSRVFFDQMHIPSPSYHLGIHSLSHGAMTGMMLMKLEEVIGIEQPDGVMVYGDTNSTLAGALAARKMNIPVAHVEAGLRSFDMSMPEEVNRILTDRISTILFCPTHKAKENLVREGFGHFDSSIVITGDVMLDAALRFLPAAVKPEIQLPDRFILATIHRQSNTDDPSTLRAIIGALGQIATERPVVIPLHPRTKAILDRMKPDPVYPSLIFTEPVGYLESLWLTSHAELVFTDSGGLQKEAYFMGKACITLRNETEWTELVDTGTNIPAGVTKTGILKAYNDLKDITVHPELELYGSGKASEHIVDELIR